MGEVGVDAEGTDGGEVWWPGWLACLPGRGSRYVVEGKGVSGVETRLAEGLQKGRQK